MLIIYYYIRDFFIFVGETISFVFQLIKSLIEVLIASGDWLLTIVRSLPLFIVAPIVALVIVSVLYKVLGREGQD